MIENEEDLLCFQKHRLPVLMIAWDIKLKKNKKLLCSKCLEILESEVEFKNFKKTYQTIEENQKLKKEQVEKIIFINIKQIEQLQQEFHQLKSNVVQQLDELIGNLDEWIKYLTAFAQQNFQYSFFEELDILITQKKLDGFNQKSLIHKITQINQSWNQKLKKLNLFNSFQESKKCQDILKVIENLNQINEKISTEPSLGNIQLQQHMNQYINQQKILKKQVMMDNQIEFNLIDDSNQQQEQCWVIVFNKTGSIMISTCNNLIKIWNFDQGRLQISYIYEVHVDDVLCLVYSKSRNNFISGSRDNTIICWQQIKQKGWKCSQPIQQHKGWVHCLILNKQEDQLITGSDDCSIRVWKVDFIKNELTFLQELVQHTNSVNSLSFNQSETVFASCGFHELIIWEKGLQGKWRFKYKQDVFYGNKIHFINDQQFIWVTKSKNIDDILVFEQQAGVFKKNSIKNIQLIQNNQCDDELYFPIIHNKEKNMILVRHKHHIYLIRQLNNALFKTIVSLNCQINETFGGMTNDGQYLVLWDNKYQKYSSYEILNK
ncbi:unnamed protein product [Paramecium sonneborni]|uniref:WD40-repeat-containing domain n=1 Tax=Paramecium sonneborni TaxID=65129 RepID=A0A8S1RTH8_9CILI|nr:unnamed protein product [Paramecium sonneborni]